MTNLAFASREEYYSRMPKISQRVGTAIGGVVLGVLLYMIPDMFTCTNCSIQDIANREMVSLISKTIVGVLLLLAGFYAKHARRVNIEIFLFSTGFVLLGITAIAYYMRAAELGV